MIQSEGRSTRRNRLLALTFDNPWLRDVEQGRGSRRPGVFVVVGVVVAFIVLLLVRSAAGAISAFVGRPSGGFDGLWRAIVPHMFVVVVLFGALLIVAVGGGLWEGRRLWPIRGVPVWATLSGLALGVIGFGACVILAFVAGAVAPGATPMFAAGAGATLIGLALVLFQASVEEVYFRGWLQPLCCLRLGPWLGLAATSALFAGLHIVSGARAPLAILNLFLGGVMFGLLALRTGGLWAPSAAHFAWNWSESGLLGLDPNPGVGVTGSLIDLDLSGPSLWSGARETMNGSLATTIGLTIIVIGLMALGPRGTANSKNAP